MEHDSARRSEAAESSSHRRPFDLRADPYDTMEHATLDASQLDRGRLIRERTIALAAAAHGDTRSESDEATAEGEDRPACDSPDAAREALGRTCLTVKRIAHDIGMPRATLEAYRLGTRRMPHRARVRLGTYLAAHAAMLDGLARTLMSPTSIGDA